MQTAALLLATRSPAALAILYNTDKGPHEHSYADLYREILKPRRRERLSVLEIGILYGGSLRLWRRYLPNATVIGIDLEPPDLEIPGVQIYRGDATDRTFLGEIIDRHGPFDLIIDDGSHIASHVRTSFEVLFTALSPCGWYVIEDLATAYDPQYEGGKVGTRYTAIELIKSLVDRTQTASGTCDVAELRLFNEICFLQRS